MSEGEFQAELKALLKRFPEQAKGFIVQPAPASGGEVNSSATATARCVRYGVDPDTGEVVCLEWE